MSIQFILLGIGSRGDVDPLIAIAGSLQAAGHEVLFVTFPQFSREVQAARLPCVIAPEALIIPLQPPAPKAWSISRWSRSLGDWRGQRALFNQRTTWLYQLIKDRHAPGRTVVVARGGLAAARVARETLDVRLATVHHSPASMRSRRETFRFPLPKGDQPHLRLVRDVIWRGSDWYVGRMLLPDLNGFRAGLGLPPVHRLFDRWAYSPDLNLGLFPDWYARPQADWPANTRLAGFPLAPAVAPTPIAPEVERFLASGDPPVVFTYGAHGDAGGRFLRAMEKVTEGGGFRGIYLGSARSPDNRPEGRLLRQEFAPLGRVLPQTRAIVHHGGIGTMAMALAAGKPQIIAPVVGDQWDQGRRVADRGWGEVIPPASLEQDLQSQLDRVATDPGIASACREAADRLASHDGIAAAARCLELASARASP